MLDTLLDIHRKFTTIWAFTVSKRASGQLTAMTQITCHCQASLYSHRVECLRHTQLSDVHWAPPVQRNVCDESVIFRRKPVSLSSEKETTLISLGTALARYLHCASALETSSGVCSCVSVQPLHLMLFHHLARLIGWGSHVFDGGRTRCMYPLVHALV